MADDTWRKVARKSDIDPDEPLAVTIGDTEIALCRIGESVYAIDNICSHEYARLSDGFVEDDCIECPLHQARFHIPSGKVMSLPAEDDLRVYPVEVRDDEIYLNVTATIGARQ